MVGVEFFFDLCSNSGLRAFFTSDFANCTTDYAHNYQVLFTASDGWGFPFNCFPILDWGHFLQMILPIVLQFIPNHQVLFTASDGWGYFFLTCSPVLDLGHFSQVILPIVLKIMPQLSGAVHSIWWLGFSFNLFSHSGLIAFFTDDFANCTTIYAQPSGAVQIIWWLGLFFFWPVLPFWT